MIPYTSSAPTAPASDAAHRSPVRSVYVHVPFCARKCDYCAFYSEADLLDLAPRYVEALRAELDRCAPRHPPETLFFGGGTPSILNLHQWERIGEAFRSLGWTSIPEWTVECNPATVSADKARLLRELGVNRLSLGVQSLDDALLDRLGRVHSRQMVFRSFDILREAGFNNLNLDLMFAIPGQTLETWKTTLAEAIALGSEHISSYEVIYEDDTPLFAQLQAGQIDVDEDLACAMYDALVDAVCARGMAQYEIANFARGPSLPAGVPTHACQHNISYWRGSSFLGLGPSACGFVDGVRRRNWANTRLYCDELEAGRLPVESIDRLPPLSRAGEIAGFGLRMTVGWAFDEFERVTGYDLRDTWGGTMDELEQAGWARRSPDRFQLTAQGLRFADAAAQAFLRP
jgi:oxygen-independent coproporphyrinogen III oxidase